MKLVLLLLGVFVLAQASSDPLGPGYSLVRESSEDKSASFDHDDVDDNRSIPDDDDDDDDDDGTDDDVEIDGIPLKFLSPEEIEELLDEDDNLFASELDIYVAGKIVRERQSGYGGTNALQTVGKAGGRKRRALLLLKLKALFAVGRALLGHFTRGKTTSSGTKTTTEYYNRSHGTVRDANTAFDRFHPNNVSSFTNKKNGVHGRTGTVGKFTVKTRSGSGKDGRGPPTLDIISPKHGGGLRIRKFRY